MREIGGAVTVTIAMATVHLILSTKSSCNIENFMQFEKAILDVVEYRNGSFNVT